MRVQNSMRTEPAAAPSMSLKAGGRKSVLIVVVALRFSKPRLARSAPLLIVAEIGFSKRHDARSRAVRLLVYRQPDDDPRVQKRARKRLKRAAGAVLFEKSVTSL